MFTLRLLIGVLLLARAARYVEEYSLMKWRLTQLDQAKSKSVPATPPPIDLNLIEFTGACRFLIPKGAAILSFILSIVADVLTQGGGHHAGLFLTPVTM